MYLRLLKLSQIQMECFKSNSYKTSIRMYFLEQSLYRVVALQSAPLFF